MIDIDFWLAEYFLGLVTRWFYFSKSVLKIFAMFNSFMILYNIKEVQIILKDFQNISPHLTLFREMLQYFSKFCCFLPDSAKILNFSAKSRSILLVARHILPNFADNPPNSSDSAISLRHFAILRHFSSNFPTFCHFSDEGRHIMTCFLL